MGVVLIKNRRARCASERCCFRFVAINKCTRRRLGREWGPRLDGQQTAAWLAHESPWSPAFSQIISTPSHRRRCKKRATQNAFAASKSIKNALAACWVGERWPLFFCFFPHSHERRFFRSHQTPTALRVDLAWDYKNADDFDVTN